MDFENLTIELLKLVVKNPDDISVKIIDSDEENILITAVVSSEDMGSVIGRQGRNIKAIRTLLQASSYVNENKKIRLEVDSI